MVADLIITEAVSLVPGGEEFIKGMGDFLGDLGKDIVKDMAKEGVMSAVKEFMADRAKARIAAAKKRLKDETGLDPRPVSAAIGIPMLNAACMEDRPELLEMWDRLLAAAMNENKAGNVRQAYIDILKRMDPLDALVFSKLSTVTNANLKQQLVVKLQRNPSEIDISFSNLAELKCGRFSQSDHTGDGNYTQIFLTSLGIELQRTLGLGT